MEQSGRDCALLGGTPAFEVCVVGDDARPPWNNASSILAKRLIECLSTKVRCYLASLATQQDVTDSPIGAGGIFVKGSPGRQAMNAVKLAIAVGGSKADIVHLVGTNALVFSPVYKMRAGRGRIVRHVFTSYDKKDRLIAPARWLANNLFIDAYAFTMPWVGQWARDVQLRTRKLLIRPPIDCGFYKPADTSSSEVVPVSTFDKTILYMGPLLASRFPVHACLGALKLITGSGINARLVVLASAGRTSPERVSGLVAMGNKMGLEDRLIVRSVDLTECQRVEAYNSADVVVFPFVGPVPERLADPPFGVLEAMSCGRVVLATRVLSIPEVVEDGVTGILAADATVATLYDGLRRGLNLENASEIGRRARRRILAEFSYGRVREDVLAAYEALLLNS